MSRLPSNFPWWEPAVFMVDSRIFQAVLYIDGPAHLYEGPGAPIWFLELPCGAHLIGNATKCADFLGITPQRFCSWCSQHWTGIVGQEGVSHAVPSAWRVGDV